ncbi:hypothetical protein [Curvivirga aplysinae]|uniref:hypothetical protein n=1 Tax=Curvivirga aplysinae TaxID=2529852 RepID=UPI0012BCA03E|nr:hypothetical protein [Curvivirga aplysinae]MTI09051.1 hypothetical protein [Curvivirga aplysinae]
MSNYKTTGRILLQCLCGLSLLLMTFAHRTNAIDPARLAELELGPLPAGFEYYICVTGTEDSFQFEYGNHCEACRVTTAVILPSTSDDLVIGSLKVAAVQQFIERAISKKVDFKLSRVTRGPPTYLS